MPATVAPRPQQQPLAERAGPPAPAPAGDEPIVATGGKVVYAQPIVAVSGAPVVAAPVSPLLQWSKPKIEWETVQLKKPRIVRTATSGAPVAPLAPLLVELPRKTLRIRAVPTFIVKPGTAVQPVIARKTILPAKTIALPEVGAWVPARAAPVAAISGSPVSGSAPEGIPIFSKFGK